MNKSTKKSQQYKKVTELKLVPESGRTQDLQIEDTYDGGFHINRTPKFDGRVVNKRSGLQSFTC
jgi:hypothetical protein